MIRIADLIKGVNQGTLPLRLPNVEVNCSAGGWTQTLPVDWNGIPSMLDQHVIPRYEGRRELGEGHGGEEGERREPVALHESRPLRRTVTSGWFRSRELLPNIPDSECLWSG